jgi:hypothetical protein
MAWDFSPQTYSNSWSVDYAPLSAEALNTGLKAKPIIEKGDIARIVEPYLGYGPEMAINFRTKNQLVRILYVRRESNGDFSAGFEPLVPAQWKGAHLHEDRGEWMAHRFEKI